MYRMALTYQKNTDILEEVAALKESFKYGKTIQTTATGKAIVKDGKLAVTLGVPPGVVEAFDEYVNMYVYGQGVQNKDISLGGMSVNRLIQTAMSYTAVKAMGLSYISAIAAATSTYANLYIKTSEGDIVNKKDIKAGYKVLTGKDENSSKFRLIAEYLDLIDKRRTEKENLSLKADKKAKILNVDNLLIGMEKVDTSASALLSAAMLNSYTLTDKGLKKIVEGSEEKSILELIEFKEGKISNISEQQLAKIKKIIQSEITEITGSASETDKTRVGTNVYLAALMQFKNLIYPMLKDRTAGIQYNADINEFTSGRMLSSFMDFGDTTLLDKLSLLGQITTEILPFIKYNRYKSSKWKNLAEKQFDKWLETNPEVQELINTNEVSKDDMMQKYLDMKIRKAIGASTELRLILTFFALMTLAGMGAAGGDDEGENFATRNLYKITKRMYQELSFYYDPDSMAKTFFNAQIPISRLYTDSFNLLKNTLDETRDELFGDYKGTFNWEVDNKDKTPIGYYTTKMLPTRVVTDMFDIWDTFKVTNKY